MPRFFISTSGYAADEDGVDLPDSNALRTLLRRALTDILRDEGERTGLSLIEAEATDTSGRTVMRAKISFSTAEP